MKASISPSLIFILNVIVLLIPITVFAQCDTFDVGVARAEVCGDLNSGDFSAKFFVSGLRVAEAIMTPFYIAEGGNRETDNSYVEAAFLIPQPPTAARVKLRILRSNRNDASEIFSRAGDVIYAQAIWRTTHAPECLVPRPSDRNSNCWDESRWRHTGRF